MGLFPSGYLGPVIQTGRYQTLTILRDTRVGLFLGDADGGEVLLPNKYVPERFELGESLAVFVYRDHEERQVATTLRPKLELDGFALLRVFDTDRHGAFMEWGMEKHLLVPFKEQRAKLEPGRWYMTTLRLDEETDRLYGSTRLDRYLSTDTHGIAAGDEVRAVVYGRSEMGWSVVVNGAYQGLIHGSDVFRRLSSGDDLDGYVKQVRPDGKLDISLSPLGFRQYNPGNVELLAERLQRYGSLALTDNSSPEDIQAAFGISKKAFKQALGTLFRERKVRITDNGVVWLGDTGTAGDQPK